MARVRIVGLPTSQGKKDSQPRMPRLHGDDPNKATVEAEKGETVLTVSGNAGNQKELASIGGETHEDGGTFLDLPPGSAIFSDHLKLKDEKMLKMFGYGGKSPKTFAQISKQYDISSLNKNLKNPEVAVDKIAKTSLEKSIKDANYKLSLLFTLQQFHEEKKGEQTEHSKHFEPFIDRTGITYEQLLNSEGMSDAPSDKQGNEVAQYGIQTKGQNQVMFAPIDEQSLPMFQDAGTTPGKNQAQPFRELPKYDESSALEKVGVDWLNGFLVDYNIPTIDTTKQWTKDQVQVKLIEAQKRAVEENPDLVFNFMSEGTADQKSHRPNEKLQEKMKVLVKNGVTKVKPTGSDGTFTNEDLKGMIAEQKTNASMGIKTADVLDAYKDNKWWYRMVTDKIKTVTQDEYNKLLPILEKEGIAQGNKKYLYKGNGVYEAYVVDEKGNVTQVEADPKDLEKLYKWNVKNIPDRAPIEPNMEYRWENDRALSQAKRNRNRIPFITPLSALPETYYTDMAYYSPDQALAAIQSIGSTRGEQQAMFAAPQTQLANQLAGNEYSLVAQITGDYADKNVNAYNAERNMNTNIAQRSADRLAQAVGTNADRWSTLKQTFANSYTNASNNVAMQEIARHKERADRINTEAAVGEQFRTNPRTGIQRFNVGKDFFPDTSKNTEITDTLSTIMTENPSMTPDMAAKLALAMHGEKYKVSSNDNLYNEDNYQG